MGFCTRLPPCEARVDCEAQQSPAPLPHLPRVELKRLNAAQLARAIDAGLGGQEVPGSPRAQARLKHRLRHEDVWYHPLAPWHEAVAHRSDQAAMPLQDGNDDLHVVARYTDADLPVLKLRMAGRWGWHGTRGGGMGGMAWGPREMKHGTGQRWMWLT